MPLWLVSVWLPAMVCIPAALIIGALLYEWVVGLLRRGRRLARKRR